MGPFVDTECRHGCRRRGGPNFGWDRLLVERLSLKVKGADEERVSLKVKGAGDERVSLKVKNAGDASEIGDRLDFSIGGFFHIV